VFLELGAFGVLLGRFELHAEQLQTPVVSPYPPEFSPNICPLLASATQQRRRLTSFSHRFHAKKLELGARELELLHSLLPLQLYAPRAQRVCADVSALQNPPRHQHYALQGVGAVLQCELLGVTIAQEQAVQPHLPSLFATLTFEGMIALAAWVSICGMLI
jgi:hypothetical protein